MKAYPMRARIRNEGAGPARVDIFDDIGAGGWFSEGYTPASFADAIKGVSGPLDVHINSCGGDVSDGIAIANAIRAYPGPKRTVVDGLAASIASVIAQAGDDRIIEPGAMMMIHDPFTGLVGNAEEMRKTADTLDKHGDNLAQQYASRAGGTQQQWRDVMKQERWYTADEAVAAGLADRVGTSAAELPLGVDIDVLAAHAPGRVMAALRRLPVRAADEAGGGDGPPACKTCDGKKRLPHPGTGKNGIVCPGCGGSGTYETGAGPGDGGSEDMQDRARAQAGKPYEPAPYHREPYENVQCPACLKFGDDDGRYCGQCGTKLIGREDVREAQVGPAASGARRPRAEVTQLGEGWVQDPDGTRRFDPDGDGDDDSTPEGDTDHDYFAPDGTPIKPIPPCPEPQDSAAGDMWAVYRLAVRDSGGKVDNSPWDGGKAMANGAAADDPAKFYAGICAGRKDGDADKQSSWALPYKYHPDGPPNAAGTKNALARLSQTEGLTNEGAAKKTLQAAMKQVNPDWEPEDSGDTSISGSWLEQYQAALKGAQ